MKTEEGTKKAARTAARTPWRIDGQAIRDAEGRVVVSAINPATMAEKRLIVEAVNRTAGEAEVTKASGRGARKASRREMLSRCDRPTRFCIPSITSSAPSTRPPRAFLSSLRMRLRTRKGL